MTFGGAASGGLCSDAYAGGTGGGWDIETWQFPWLLTFYPEMAQPVLQYRIDRQDGAHANAIIPRSEPGLLVENISYDGLLYPIMTALTGLDNDGEPEPHWPSEDHMTGDISLAMQQFYQATRNDTWLKTEAFPLLDGIARFWASKAARNGDGSYSVSQTGSPDEYHNNITDGVFPNSIAKVSLLGAYDLAAAAGRQPNATYKTIGDGLRILYDAKRDFHPAYITGATGELYNSTCGAPEPLACINTPSGGLIKQADVVLIYYPVAINGTRYNVSIPSSTQKNDLDIYSRLTDINGPAMTWMIHSIAYGDIGEDDKAAAFLRKSYEGLVRSPFFIWHEGFGLEGGAPNFVNAAGMFAANLFAGYGGVRWPLGEDYLELRRPRPPPNCTKLVLRRVYFRGARINIEATKDSWSVALDEPAPAGVVLQLETDDDAPHTLTTAAVSRLAGSSGRLAVQKSSAVKSDDDAPPIDPVRPGSRETSVVSSRSDVS